MVHPVLFSSDKQNWRTPTDLFNKLNKLYNFDCDVCADDANALCDKYFTELNSCLDNDWHKINFMNPPYGREISKFVERAYDQWMEKDCTTVALIPARTDTKYFHEYIYNKATIVFIKGRLKFEGDARSAKGCAPFPSMIAIWYGNSFRPRIYDEYYLDRYLNKDGK